MRFDPLLIFNLASFLLSPFVIASILPHCQWFLTPLTTPPLSSIALKEHGTSLDDTSEAMNFEHHLEMRETTCRLRRTLRVEDHLSILNSKFHFIFRNDQGYICAKTHICVFWNWLHNQDSFVMQKTHNHNHLNEEDSPKADVQVRMRFH